MRKETEEERKKREKGKVDEVAVSATKTHRIRRAVEAEKRARRDDAFEKHAQHLTLI